MSTSEAKLEPRPGGVHDVFESTIYELLRAGDLLGQAGEEVTRTCIRTVLENFKTVVLARDRSRAGVSVHGSDACSGCATGRITLYAGSRICPECIAKRAGAQSHG